MKKINQEPVTLEVLPDAKAGGLYAWAMNRLERTILWLPLAAVFLPLSTALAQTQSVTFTNDTLIEASDASHDGQNIVVSNCNLTVNGQHSFASLNLISNATLTHSPAPNGETDNKIDIAINGDVLVDASSKVLADGLGYSATQGPGAGIRNSWAAGGGYGGMGGTYNAAGGRGYGLLAAPADFGSGGSDDGSSGGGAIHLAVGGTLDLDGTITAAGLTGSSSLSGGSGGSIWLEATTIGGTGSIQANGGFGADNGGGGGRIAIFYHNDSFSGTTTAWGGTEVDGGEVGGAGTVFSKETSSTMASVVLENNGNIGAGTSADEIEGGSLDVTVVNAAQAILYGGETWTIGQLQVGTNSSVLCFGTNNTGLASNEWAGTGVTIAAQSITVDAGGTISADGQGYAAGQGPGAGIRATWAGGGGHGGMGGAANASGGGAYGSLTQPTELGSGGADAGNPGGGAIRLVIAGSLQMNGTLTANAVHYGNHGGGAGGSIWIEAGTLAGDGIIQANGGQGGNDNGGGAGRIAAIYQVNNYSGTVTAWGGLNGQGGSVIGGAGTIVWQCLTNASSYVTLDNDGHVGAYTPGELIEGTNLIVTVTNGTQVAINGGETWAVNQLLVATNSTVLCFSTNNTGPVSNEWVGGGVAIAAQFVTVDSGGTISADGQGYAAGQGPGAGVRFTWAGGGGHGGMGGTANAGGGSAYGSLTQPTELGSGGADAGNPGGGAIRFIVSGSMHVDGIITASALHFADHGGGAGGSIWIKTGALAGVGTIQPMAPRAATTTAAAVAELPSIVKSATTLEQCRPGVVSTVRVGASAAGPARFIGRAPAPLGALSWITRVTREPTARRT
ncbi:MAG: hypothetical protein ACLQVY_28830 [Limisphaerales bacterium]